MRSFQEREPKLVPEPTAAPRLEPFSYECRRCSRCCHHKSIQVNPYEVARLARKLGQTTTEFRMAWTQDSAGAVLKRTDAGACVFLGASGCTVHSDRPLVCRFYPLGRHVLPNGIEWFSHIEPHPQSEGHANTDSTIGEYVEKQGAMPFIVAADEYFFGYVRQAAISTKKRIWPKWMSRSGTNLPQVHSSIWTWLSSAIAIRQVLSSRTKLMIV